MLRLCPHHGLEKWLIIHTFYSGLLFTTKMNVNAATSGALMNKTYTLAYTLIEYMAQNHYQWISERAVIVVAPPPSKKEAGMYGISSLNHQAANVDALTQKFDKMNTSVVTPAPVSPPCEICGMFGHTSVECQLGSVVESPQYNQGMRPNQFFYKTPQNPYGQQTTPPDCANNLLLEKCVMDKSKQFEELKNQTGFLNDSLVKL